LFDWSLLSLPAPLRVEAGCYAAMNIGRPRGRSTSSGATSGSPTGRSETTFLHSTKSPASSRLTPHRSCYRAGASSWSACCGHLPSELSYARILVVFGCIEKQVYLCELVIDRLRLFVIKQFLMLYCLCS
jgi:hypothetical protein